MSRPVPSKFRWTSVTPSPRGRCSPISKTDEASAPAGPIPVAAAQRLQRSLRALRELCDCPTCRTMESRMKTVALATVLTLVIGAYAPAPGPGPSDTPADAHQEREPHERQAGAV